MNESSPSSSNQPKENAHRNRNLTALHREDGPAWYLVHCKPNAERTALRNLENQSFSVFLPLQKMTRRRGTAFQTLKKPLFPGYIFVAQSSFEGQWQKINNTRGVARLVTLSAKPSPVPSEIMHQLFERCDKSSVFQENEALVVGDDVKITQGSLTGSIAKIIKVDPDRRVHLLFQFMGQESTLEIDVAGVTLNG